MSRQPAPYPPPGLATSPADAWRWGWAAGIVSAAGHLRMPIPPAGGEDYYRAAWHAARALAAEALAMYPDTGSAIASGALPDRVRAMAQLAAAIPCPPAPDVEPDADAEPAARSAIWHEPPPRRPIATPTSIYATAAGQLPLLQRRPAYRA